MFSFEYQSGSSFFDWLCSMRSKSRDGLVQSITSILGNSRTVEARHADLLVAACLVLDCTINAIRSHLYKLSLLCHLQRWFGLFASFIKLDPTDLAELRNVTVVNDAAEDLELVIPSQFGNAPWFFPFSDRPVLADNLNVVVANGLLGHGLCFCRTISRALDRLRTGLL